MLHKLAIALCIVLMLLVGAALTIRVVGGGHLAYQDFLLPFFAAVLLLQLWGSHRHAQPLPK